jgi:hypothetical protein
MAIFGKSLLCIIRDIRGQGLHNPVHHLLEHMMLMSVSNNAYPSRLLVSVTFQP